MPSNFTFDSGRSCLDFMATLVDRKGAAIERLDSPDKLAEVADVLRDIHRKPEGHKEAIGGRNWPA